MNDTTTVSAAAGRRVPVDWIALANAFEYSAAGVRWYLHVRTGAVFRVVDGLADPDARARVEEDPDCVPIDAIHAREQYRWLEAFIVTVKDVDLRLRLMQSIQGRGSFRRFKSALFRPELLRRWREFQTERLRAAIDAWFRARGLVPVSVERPSASAGCELLEAPPADPARQRLHAAASALPRPDLDALASLAEFLCAARSVGRLLASLSAQDAELPGGLVP